MVRLIAVAATIAFACIASAAGAAELAVTMHKITDAGIGEAIGRVYFKDGPKGLVVTPRLKGLPPGEHGFHVHANRSCDAAASPSGQRAAGLAAGGHYDPGGTGKHLGPEGEGHKGDLPKLTVAADGTTKGSLLAPHLKVAHLRRHSLMIHAGGDNYADQPQPLGGGGARIACGVF
jgi:Cu-Zn family superoxide dismutase